MAASLAEIIILCLLADWLFRKFRLPGLVGMLFVGALLGPHFLGWLDGDLLAISSELRMIALVVILLRSGLELSWSTLKKVGKNALLLSFLPGLFEAGAVVLLAPPLLGLSLLEAGMLGYILAAVSPAVVVPAMIGFNRDGRGTAKGIPTLVLAGASLDDVVAIVGYAIFAGLYAGSSVSVPWMLAGIPLSIILGVLIGVFAGILLYTLFDRFNPRATKRALAMLGLALILVQGGSLLQGVGVPFAALVAVMASGFIILERREKMAHELSAKFGKIWIFAQIVLFAMVGAQVDFTVAIEAGGRGALLIALALIARSVGTLLSTIGSGLNAREVLFVILSYTPKATVQAAMGAAPLALMLSAGMPTGPGQIILAIAVLSIVLTAPTGAMAIQWAGRALLSDDGPASAATVRQAALESGALKDDEEMASAD
jgi:solute carrier family 9B (sodium/hydrogen exchanger), member 1/2